MAAAQTAAAAHDRILAFPPAMQPAQLVAELHDDQFELFSNLTVSSGAMVCCVCMNYLCV